MGTGAHRADEKAKYAWPGKGNGSVSVVATCGCSSMVELQPSKLATWVRFPSPAPSHRGVRTWYLLFF
jgi:hypothetical protein